MKTVFGDPTAPVEPILPPASDVCDVEHGDGARTKRRVASPH